MTRPSPVPPDPYRLRTAERDLIVVRFRGQPEPNAAEAARAALHEMVAPLELLGLWVEPPDPDGVWPDTEGHFELHLARDWEKPSPGVEEVALGIAEEYQMPTLVSTRASFFTGTAAIMRRDRGEQDFDAAKKAAERPAQASSGPPKSPAAAPPEPRERAARALNGMIFECDGCGAAVTTRDWGARLWLRGDSQGAEVQCPACCERMRGQARDEARETAEQLAREAVEVYTDYTPPSVAGGRP